MARTVTMGRARVFWIWIATATMTERRTETTTREKWDTALEDVATMMQAMIERRRRRMWIAITRETDCPATRSCSNSICYSEESK